MVSLEGKKILFIGIGFYDYEEAIRNIFLSRGATVNYVNSSYMSLVMRILNRLKFERYYKKLQSKVIKKQIKRFSDNEIVFTIKGENLSEFQFKLLKKLNPDAKFILYLWDSLIRHDNSDLLLSHFDIIWSFDRLDCEKNPKLKFRPLFYRSIPESKDKIYELSFIGWVHSDRLEILRKFKELLVESGKPYYLKLYMGRYKYLWSRYITRSITSFDEDLIITKPVNYKQFQHILSVSSAILDLSHPLQSGLTMRTIEALAAGCHLITTNIDIENYDDISNDCYTIFDSKKDFLPNFHNELGRTKNIGVNYSLDSFINQIFEKN